MNTQLEEQLKQQAEQHAMEARSQRATVHEIYQALGIQKGDWNGAAPVIEKFKAIQLNAARYEFLRDEDYWGEDSGDDCWEALGEAHGSAFDAIVDSRIERCVEDNIGFDNAL